MTTARTRKLNKRFRAIFLLSAFGALVAVGLSFGVAISLKHANESYAKKLAHSFIREFSTSTGGGAVSYGKYESIRRKMDYAYHGVYKEDRMMLQDGIVDTILAESRNQADQNDDYTCQYTKQWIVFTAGAMGAGKSHTIKALDHAGRFPLDAFIVVDPDQIRNYFPEYHEATAKNPEGAGELTQKEAGLISEMLTWAALKRGHNVLVDGSLRDWSWYRHFFVILRRNFPDLSIAILHVLAPPHIVLKNAANRAEVTGRVVPHKVLENSIQQVPKSVEILRSMVDFSVDIYNSGQDEISITTEGLDWDMFRRHWEDVSICYL